MLRVTVRNVLVLVALCAVTLAPASAAEEAREGAGVAAAEPLPFLTADLPDCAAAQAGLEAAAVPLPTFLSTSTGANQCTGCSSHNCFFQAEGARCLINGERGQCVAHNFCPEIRELSCHCVPI